MCVAIHDNEKECDLTHKRQHPKIPSLRMFSCALPRKKSPKYVHVLARANDHALERVSLSELGSMNSYVRVSFRATDRLTLYSAISANFLSTLPSIPVP